MKKIFNLAAMAVLTIGLASCAKDDIENNGGDPIASGNTFTFTLPLQSGVISYADPIATDNENKLSIANTSIYIFGADNKLEVVVGGSDIEEGTDSNGKTTATIEIDESWTWSGNKTFYMVGNTNMDAAAKLATVVVGTTTIAQFEALTTADQSGEISSTNGLLMAGVKAVTNVDQTPGTELTLYRSVARFDINQNVSKNNVRITGVHVLDANLSGLIYAYNQAIPSGATVGDINDIATAYADDATSLVDVTENSKTYKYQQEKAVFYLYPTQLKAENADGTVIQVIGEDKFGNSAIYTLNKEDSNFDIEDLTIKANHRYIISAIDTDNYTFTLTIADWSEGEEIVGRPDNSVFALIAPADADITNGTFFATYNVIAIGDPTAAFSADFAVRATSSKGVEVTVVTTTATGLIQVGTDVINVTTPSTDATVSYAAPYFKSTLTASFEAGKIEDGKNFSTILRVKDIASGESTDIYLFYGIEAVDDNGKIVLAMYKDDRYGVNMPAVKVGDTWWAPVNVGAKTTDVNASIDEYGGLLFQWGRNIGWPLQTTEDKLSEGQTVEGPITTSEIANYSDKFIITNGASDWLSDGANERAWDNAPCPDGWRIPRHNDCTSLLDAFGWPTTLDVGYDEANNRYVLQTETGELYFPLVGFLAGDGDAGSYLEQNLVTSFWSLSGKADPVKRGFVRFSSQYGGIDWRETSRGNAFSIRCVR